MFGSYSLLRLLNRGDVLAPFQVNCFRAGYLHAGVLLVTLLLYVSGLNSPFRFSQAGSLRGNFSGNPGPVGRILSPHDGWTAEQGIRRNHRHHDRGSAVGLCCHCIGLWLDYNTLKGIALGRVMDLI